MLHSDCTGENSHHLINKLSLFTWCEHWHACYTCDDTKFMYEHAAARGRYWTRVTLNVSSKMSHQWRNQQLSSVLSSATSVCVSVCVCVWERERERERGRERERERAVYQVCFFSCHIWPSADFILLINVVFWCSTFSEADSVCMGIALVCVCVCVCVCVRAQCMLDATQQAAPVCECDLYWQGLMSTDGCSFCVLQHNSLPEYTEGCENVKRSQKSFLWKVQQSLAYTKFNQDSFIL